MLNVWCRFLFFRRNCNFVPSVVVNYLSIYLNISMYFICINIHKHEKISNLERFYLFIIIYYYYYFSSKNITLASYIEINTTSVWQIFTIWLLLRFYRTSRKHACIILTPFNPTFIKKKWVYRRIHYFSYFAKKNYSQSTLVCFEQKYKKYQNFLSEHFPFLVIKFSIYLNRSIFVIMCLP